MAVKSTVTSLFGKSPFKGLQLHMQSVLETANELPGLIQALNEGNQAKIQELKEKICVLEGKADELKNSMRSHMPKSIFMPVDRRDLLDMLDLQDNIADNAEEIATLLTLRAMKVPVGMEKPLTDLCALSLESCTKAHATISELHLLVETGFSGPEAGKVTRMIVELSAMRAETGKLCNELSKKVFSLEDQLQPVAVLMWFRIVRHLGELAHNAEQVGDRLRLLMAI